MGEPWSVVLCVNQSSPWSVVLANTSMTSFADPRPRRSPQAQLEGGAFGTTKGARRPAAHLNRRLSSGAPPHARSASCSAGGPGYTAVGSHVSFSGNRQGGARLITLSHGVGLEFKMKRNEENGTIFRLNRSV